MDEQEVLRILGEVQAVIKDSHVVYTSGMHGTAYVNKDAVFTEIPESDLLARAIAEQFANDGVEVVTGPTVGGALLARDVARELIKLTGCKISPVFAEPEEAMILEAREKTTIPLPEGTFDRENEPDTIVLAPGEKLVVRKPGLIIKRGYNKKVAGKKVLVVEDVLTTGGSAKKAIEAVRAADGDVIGLAVLCNRGGVTLDTVGLSFVRRSFVMPGDEERIPPRLFALVNVKLDAWKEADCPLCAQNIPINTDVGKGRDYLSRKGIK